jgi:hypothetical protein
MAISHSSTLMTVPRPALKETKSRRWGYARTRFLNIKTRPSTQQIRRKFNHKKSIRNNTANNSTVKIELELK